MAREILILAPGVGYLPGGTNRGLLVNEAEKRAAAVDAGMDRDSARQLLSAATAAGGTVTDVFLTHAHADHFGGAAFLRERTGAAVAATGLEAAVVAHPELEPLYLFAGGAPPAELRGKFLLGQACAVDRVVEPGEAVALAGLECRVESLPGHTLAQAGLGYGPVLFAGDAFFLPSVLEKHPIPVFAAPREARQTLARLPELEYEWFVPGHGPAVDREGLRRACTATLAALDRLTEAVLAALAAGPRTTEELLAQAAEAVGDRLETLASVCLARLTIQGIQGELADAGTVRPLCRGNTLLWESA
ncbi:MAG TPA: MBL fold metallo-hydrolase [Firmicutes bacterium]|nr:MBL fold metallo-hydrolase [Bacillota bacterium]